MIKLKTCKECKEDNLILSDFNMCSNCLRIWMTTTKEGKKYYENTYKNIL